MAALAVAVAVAVAVVGRSAGDDERQDGPGGPPSPSLVVRIEATPGAGGFEGAVGHLVVRGLVGRRLQRPGGEIVRHRALLRTQVVAQDLPPGAYRVLAFRPACAGTCATLDPPTAPCARTVTVRRGSVTAVKVRHAAGEDCTIALN